MLKFPALSGFTGQMPAPIHCASNGKPAGAETETGRGLVPQGRTICRHFATTPEEAGVRDWSILVHVAYATAGTVCTNVPISAPADYL